MVLENSNLILKTTKATLKITCFLDFPTKEYKTKGQFILIMKELLKYIKR